MSVTSREVAAILSTAGPLAPPSDDDDDNYSDDDVTEPEEHLDGDGGRSSGMQLLKLSSTSSTSPSNTSTGTSIGPDSLAPPPPPPPPRHGNTPVGRGSHAAVPLNNGRTGRGAAAADEFRPRLNGGVFEQRRDGVGALGQPPNGDVVKAKDLHGVGLHQQVALFDLLTTHRLLAMTLEVRPNNGHHVRGPPFQVGSRYSGSASQRS